MDATSETDMHTAYQLMTVDERLRLIGIHFFVIHAFLVCYLLYRDDKILEQNHEPSPALESMVCRFKNEFRSVLHQAQTINTQTINR